MFNKEIVRFDQDGLYDFKSYLLPNVYEQLLLVDDFDSEMVICIGALVDQIPAGAIIVQLLDGNEIFIHSIYVDENFRKSGLGKDLIQGVLTEALPVFTAENSIVNYPTRLFMHIDYSMEAKEISDFECFLNHVGFTDYHEMEHCYLLNNLRSEDCLPATNKQTPFLNDEINILSLSDCIKAAESENNDTPDISKVVSDYLFDQGFSIDPKFIYILVKEEKLASLICAEEENADEYLIRSFAADENSITKAEYTALFLRLFQSIKEYSDTFDLIVDGFENLFPDFWEELARQKGIIYQHKEAGCYLELNFLDEE